METAQTAQQDRWTAAKWVKMIALAIVVGSIVSVTLNTIYAMVVYPEVVEHAVKIIMKFLGF